MTRIAPDAFLAPHLDTNAAGFDGAGAGRGAADAGAHFEELYELLDRVAVDSHRPRQAATATATAPPAAAKRKDPTDLPSPAERLRSLAAIAAAGFTDVHLRSVPYFNQGNREWAGHPYPKSPPVPGEPRTIKDAGCAPTSLAMIDCGLRDAHTRPETVADFAVSRGHSGSPNSVGSDTARLARDWAHGHGFGLTAGTSADQSRNVDVLRAGLEANGIALVSVGVDAARGRGHFTSGGHVLVINGCAMRGGEEWFAVANPGRANQSRPHDGLLATDADVMRIAGAHNGIGQVWISRAQLEAEMKRCFVFRAGVES